VTNPENLSSHLPSDGFAGTLIGRVWAPAGPHQEIAGPSPVWVTEKGVLDLSPLAPTCSDLINNGFSARDCDVSRLRSLGDYGEILANTLAPRRDPGLSHFLSPVDLQAVKACGVTFAVSMLERVIEERAGGDADRAKSIREKISGRIGTDLSGVRPGSAKAEELKRALQAEGLWSQYLEVGIGPYAEIFTKAQPLSSVGTGAEVGVLSVSSWNNPEPETVLLVDARGKIAGATLGNDVNLRDIEGRSALLLGKAKDNNASCAVGPFVRLFDATFTLDDVRSQEVELVVEGGDGFRLSGRSPMRKISRDLSELVAQTLNENHQYPDGLALFTGTLFAPTQDRDGVGKGFTHKIGDVVRIRSEKLGTLQNRVEHCHRIPPWDFGVSALMKNLHRRGLL
jgi:fumarylacetoacetate (FAA) hydrolase family protein